MIFFSFCLLTPCLQLGFARPPPEGWTGYCWGQVRGKSVDGGVQKEKDREMMEGVDQKKPEEKEAEDGQQEDGKRGYGVRRGIMGSWLITLFLYPMLKLSKLEGPRCGSACGDPLYQDQRCAGIRKLALMVLVL